MRTLLILLWCGASAWSQAPDPLLQAMRDELARSRALKVLHLESPYFIEYGIDDGETFAAMATLGGLVSQRHERFRVPRLRVRVGDYGFDNGNYVGTEYPFGTRYHLEGFPLDDVYSVLRRYLWLHTDTAYKSAVEAISRKRAALKNIAGSDHLDDFAKAKPVKVIRDAAGLDIDQDAWIRRVRELSAIFARYPRVKTSDVEVQAVQSSHYLVNTEGTELRVPEHVIFLRVRATAQAPDGMDIRNAMALPSLDLEGLPPQAELARRIAEMAEATSALVQAPSGEDYIGPVLFEGMAGPQIIAELLGRNLALTRRPVAEPGRPVAIPYSQLDGRLGARILPEWMDVIDDPTRAEWNGQRLFGNYSVDREGVVPEPLTLVEKGVLKNFLLTRQPVRGFNTSNGRARMPGSFGAKTAGLSNLFVRCSETHDAEGLRKQLIEICRSRGKPYGMIIRQMDFPSSASVRELRQLLAGAGSGPHPVSDPVLAYRLYPDGRQELVRGLRFRGLNARSLKDILAAGNDDRMFAFLNNPAPLALMGAGGYAAESAVIAPSILIDDLELHPAQEQSPKLPVVPPPASPLANARGSIDCNPVADARDSIHLR